MPARRLGPNRFVVFEYNLPKEGRVTLDLESDIPIKTYVVRPKGLDLYREGSKAFKYYGGFPDPRKHQHQTVWLPFSGPWYLIVSNPNPDDSADFEYEVSF
jgi:hypothetical protein